MSSTFSSSDVDPPAEPEDSLPDPIDAGGRSAHLEPDRVEAELRSDDPAARKRLFERLYDELKAIASNRLRAQGHSIHTTELVHEAYLKLAEGRGGAFADRGHFCAVAARAMRQILVDRARHKWRVKRGGEQRTLPLLEQNVVVLPGEVDILSLDEALTELARFDERLGRVVELRAFGGFSVDEVAALLEISPRSVKSSWRAARAWLRHFLSADTPLPDPESPADPSS